jgi:hypothetical protein
VTLDEPGLQVVGFLGQDPVAKPVGEPPALLGEGALYLTAQRGDESGPLLPFPLAIYDLTEKNTHHLSRRVSVLVGKFASGTCVARATSGHDGARYGLGLTSDG